MYSLVKTELLARAVAASAAGSAPRCDPDRYDGRLRDGARADHLRQVGRGRRPAQGCVCGYRNDNIL